MTVTLTAYNLKQKQLAEQIAQLDKEKIYNGRIVSVLPFGVLVEALPGIEGLCRIAELDSNRLPYPDDLFKGDEIFVKIIDESTKGLRLSEKAANLIRKISVVDIPAIIERKK